MSNCNIISFALCVFHIHHYCVLRIYVRRFGNAAADFIRPWIRKIAMASLNWYVKLCTKWVGTRHCKRPLVGWKVRLSVHLWNVVLHCPFLVRQGRWNQHRWSTGLLNGWIGRWGSQILLWLRGGKLTSVLLVDDKQMSFIVQYAEVSILTWRNVPVAEIWTLYQFSFYIILQTVNWRQRRIIAWYMPCFPSSKVH